jgi:hypothetical protein
MFNNFLANEEAQREIKRRSDEAETYSLQKRLGYGEPKATRWILALVLMIALAVMLLN